MLVNAAEHYAALPDNKTKLTNAAEAFERHLFLWIDSKQGATIAAFAFGQLPGRQPDLFDSVDAVWLAEALVGGRVWRYHRREGWRVLGRAAT